MRERNLTKILGLSLLAIVAVMAVNASAASANWLLLRNLASVKTLNLDALVLNGELLVPDLNLEIYCPHGHANATLLDLDSPSELDVHAEGIFLNCIVLDFTSFCTVHSPGEANGEIIALGEGKATMSGTNVTANFESEEFTEIQFLNPLCPFFELDSPVSGSAHIILLNANTDSVEKLAHLDDLELFFLGEKAEIDGVHLKTPPTPHEYLDTVLAHVTEESGQKWAIELTNL
jgi:hypothetical protein